MNNLALRLILWLARRYGVVLIDEQRRHISTDAVERGARWEQFYREAGGLADMILAVRKGYFEAAAGLGLSERDKLYEYALADRIAREIDRQVQGVVVSGQIEANKIAAGSAQNIAQLRR